MSLPFAWDSASDSLANELPWLQRLCASYTGSSSAAEDLAQETLLIAWRRREQLRESQALRPWLATIARNVCRHWRRSQRRAAQHDLLPRPAANSTQSEAIENTPDPFDLEVALERHELATLLDRALALLTPATRTALIQHYIEELPQAELAARFGIQPGTLAVRLHRGKLALRNILLTNFPDEAAAYGFVDTTHDTWQETRIWCPICGTRHLFGRVVGKQLQLDCIGCLGLERSMLFRANFAGPVPPFRPALEKMFQSMPFSDAGIQPIVNCPHCDQPLSFRAKNTPTMGFYYVEAFCRACACRFEAGTSVNCLTMAHPQGQRFWKGHSRICTLPDQMLELDGQQTILTTLQDMESDQQFTMLIASHNLMRITSYTSQGLGPLHIIRQS